jgi:hypothetical protein
MSNLSPGAPTHCGWGPGDIGAQKHKFSNIYIYIICVYRHYSFSKERKNDRQDGLGPWAQ